MKHLAVVAYATIIGALYAWLKATADRAYTDGYSKAIDDVNKLNRMANKTGRQHV
jgi:hypothetical protein